MEYGERRRRREYEERDEDSEYEERQREIDEIVREFEERCRSREEPEDTESESEEKGEDPEYEERQREISERVKEFEERRRHRAESEGTESEPDEGEGLQKETEESDEERIQEDSEEQQEIEQSRELAAEVSMDESEEDREVQSDVEAPDKAEQDAERGATEHDESGAETSEPEDKDEYDDLEKLVMEAMEEQGINPDELRERWRERFVEDVEDELGENEQNGSETKEEEEEKSAASGATEIEEGYSTYEDGSGQLYVVKTESSEHAEIETETEAAVESEQHETPTERPSAEPTVEREQTVSSEESEHPQNEAHTQPAQESVEHTSGSEQPAEQAEQTREVEKSRSESPETARDEAREQESRPEESSVQREHVEEAPEEREQRQEEQGQEERLWPSLFPESREDRAERVAREWQEQIDRVWESLTEEVRDAFREDIRKRLQDEEDLEELVTRHEQEELLDDEEVREEIERYLSFRERLQEGLDSGKGLEEVIEELVEELHIDPEVAEEWAQYQSVPEELRDLMARETQYRWSHFLRSVREAELPRSIEDVREAFDDMLLEDELEELTAWLEVRSTWQAGEIRITVHEGLEWFDSDQVRDLSFRYGVDEGRIVGWLRGFLPPRVREYLERKSAEPEGTAGEEFAHARGGPREVKAQAFRFGGIEYRSPAMLEGLIRDQFPGILDRKDFGRILSVAAAQARLLEGIGERRAITRFGLVELAEGLGIDVKQAEELVFDGREPLLHRLLRYATSQSELDELASRFRERLGDLRGPDAVEARLQQLFPQGEHINARYHRQRQGNVVDFFRLLTDARGGTTRGLASRMGIPERLVQDYLKGEFPYYVRLALAGSGRLRLEEPTRYRLRIYVPTLHGKAIESYEGLLAEIESKHPGFLRRKDAARLLEDVRIHLGLVREFAGVESIPRGEVAAITRRVGKSPTVVKRWLLQGARPRFYYWLNKVSRGDRVVRVEGVSSALNGVTDVSSMVRRLGTLYYYESIRASDTHAYNEQQARKFFEFLEKYQRGGIAQDIARQLGIAHTTLTEWLRQAQLPSEVKLASLVPATPPREGHRWLPLRVNHLTNAPEQFIEVPLRITGPEDIIGVLEQIRHLRSPEEATQVERAVDFMYVLGLAVADGSFHYDVDYSARLELYASKKYPWSRALGEGFCDILRGIGFSSERHADSVRIRHGKRQVCRVWTTEASPFLMWIKNVMLGLDAGTTKKEEPIHAEWVLQMPREWRVAFVQGLADGDGSASFKSFYVRIATVTNQEFYAKLLMSLGIRPYISKKSVSISKYDEIQRAGTLPFFRHATGRQERLKDICEVIVGYSNRRRGKIPREQVELITTLYAEGKSVGEITEELWYRYGIARTPRSIYFLLRRIEKKKKRDST